MKNVSVSVFSFALLTVIPLCEAVTPQEAEMFPYGGGKLVLNETFDTGFRYKLPAGCELRPIDGINGTTALKINGATNQKEIFTIPLDGLLENHLYEARVKVRSRNIKGKVSRQRNVIFGIEQLRKSDNRIVVCDYPVFQEDSAEYRKICVTFQPRPGNKVRFSFNAWRNWNGEVWYDDLEIRSVGRDVAALLRYPSNLTIREKKRRIEIKCSDTIPQNASLLVRAEQNGKTVNHLICRNPENLIFTCELPALENGDAKITIKVLDEEKQVYLYQGVLNVRVDDQSKIPAYAVRIDRHGRTIVNGKPFMPFGVYGLFHDKDLKRIADAGFNCAQIYASFTMHGNPKTGDPVKDIRNRLDAFQRHNLKLLFSVNQQLPGYFQGAEEFAGGIGKLAAARRVAEIFGNHPALLGYYVSDEVSRSLVPEIVKLRETLAKADPWHPSWTLTYRMNDLPYYGISGDVIGVDPYPISAVPVKPTLDRIVTDMKGALSTGLPVWVVPQIMNYGVYTHKKAEDFAGTRGPNEKEMRSMPLLCAIMGARGFIFYSYIAIFLHSERIMPGSSTTQWANVVAMAKTMRSLEDFILSIEPEIPIRVKAKPEGRVMARLFKNDAGDYALVIVALGPDKSEAVIELPSGVPVLKSEFKQTRHLGGNRYRFHADAIDSDVLR